MRWKKAQSNTLVCKEKMNLTGETEKMAGTAGAVPATMPGFFGGGPGQKPNYSTTTFATVNRKDSAFRFSEQGFPGRSFPHKPDS
jgi:hypothetical protein